MSYHIEFKKSALKELQKCPSNVQSKILDSIALLRINPFTQILNIKKLKGAEALFRLRIGEYRLIYEIQANKLILVVIKIGHRKEIYRGI